MDPATRLMALPDRTPRSFQNPSIMVIFCTPGLHTVTPYTAVGNTERKKHTHTQSNNKEIVNKSWPNGRACKTRAQRNQSLLIYTSVHCTQGIRGWRYITTAALIRIHAEYSNCRGANVCPRTCLTSPSKACSVRTRLASVEIKILCPSALNFILVHRACDKVFAFFGRKSVIFSINSSTYKL